VRRAARAESQFDTEEVIKTLQEKARAAAPARRCACTPQQPLPRLRAPL
jgi:hypothetical protein